MKRKICVVTGTRAEYGLLRWVMQALAETSGIELQIVATGTHLSSEFGLTYREIEKDGFRIDRRVEMLLSSDTPVALVKSMGIGLVGFGEALAQLQPDIVMVLGDRFEIFAVAAAATILGIPIAHLHGGETTEGAFDEAMRHSVTKMSHIHFVATEEYRRRVIQLGENPESVFLVGGLGVDAIRKVALIDRGGLEAELGLSFSERNLMVTFHPVTLESPTSAADQITELLAALKPLRETTLIFTMPNADTGSRVISEAISAFVAEHPRAYVYTSLGQQRYLSVLKQVDAVVGNSSSGLTEAPTFGKATVNIGDRQRGRAKAESVIDCEPNRKSITDALRKVYSVEFQALLRTVKNPYGEGGAARKITEVIREYPLHSVLKKRFYNVEHQ